MVLGLSHYPQATHLVLHVPHRLIMPVVPINVGGGSRVGGEPAGKCLWSSERKRMSGAMLLQ